MTRRMLINARNPTELEAPCANTNRVEELPMSEELEDLETWLRFPALSMTFRIPARMGATAGHGS